jgi:rhodanese-related sulfurtransferase
MAVRTIMAEELFRRRREGMPVDLIDVRTPAEYESAHAEGARSVPLDALDVRAVLADRPAGSPLYVICQAGGRAAKACERFAEAGFRDVFNVDGGTAAWERAGLPLVSGTRRTISIERQVRIGAGALVLLGVLLGLFVHGWFLGIPAFVGAGLVFAGITDWCGMGMMLARMPWNRATRTACWEEHRPMEGR